MELLSNWWKESFYLLITLRFNADQSSSKAKSKFDISAQIEWTAACETHTSDFNSIFQKPKSCLEVVLNTTLLVKK